MDTEVEVTIKINGTPTTRRVPVRVNLVDFLRYDMGLTGSSYTVASSMKTCLS